MDSIDTILNSISASRSEFADAFLLAQVSLPLEERREFEAVARVADDREAFRKALVFAQQGQWLEDFIDALIEADREAGDLLLSKLGKVKGDAALQGFTKKVRGLSNPSLAARGFNYAMQWTAEVFVDGASNGSGILIGPHLVLTAWHVVQELFSNASGQWTAIPGAEQRIQVQFGNHLVKLKQSYYPQATVRVNAHALWCPLFRPCHTRELRNLLPDEPMEFDGCWDFAVIRLSRMVGFERRWAQMDARAVVPQPGAMLYVFEHAERSPLQFDVGGIVAPDDTWSAAVPKFRFLHNANAAPGASGAPCFDQNFVLCGIHQGQWSGSHGSTVTNRGIPIARIRECINSHPLGLPAPDPQDCAAWHLGPARSYYPVIGCDVFQAAVWDAASGGQRTLITIVGDEGHGKTFRVGVLHGILPEAGHRKIGLDAPAFAKMDALAFAGELCAQAGAPVPNWVPVDAANTTVSTWLKDEVLHKVMLALDSVRNNCQVWITLSNLNRCDIDGENTSEFLLLLYEQLLTTDWLRIVLDGMRAGIPGSLVGKVNRQVCGSLQQEDLLTYLRRACAECEIIAGDFDLQVHAKRLYRSYEVTLATDPAKAARGLSEQTMEVIKDYLDILN